MKLFVNFQQTFLKNKHQPIPRDINFFLVSVF